MQNFEADLASVFSDRGYNFRSNLGRRNALLSVSQEKEVARVLRKKFKRVIEDGAPGKPDIYIEDIDRELECKLTSGTRSSGSVVYALQTDWDTICQKKKLDYLYFITDEKFSSFCVLFFEGLTPDDFFPPASGSRGKSRMNKAKAMQKVTCLVGDYLNHNSKYINEITSTNMKEFENHMQKMRKYWQDYTSINLRDTVKKDLVLKMKNAETLRHQKSIAKLSKRMKYWTESPQRYKFILESI
mgnify:CR=1 FL=1